MQPTEWRMWVSGAVVFGVYAALWWVCFGRDVSAGRRES